MATGNQTNITPPRVAIIDERTGAISREWYRWFYSLFTTLGSGTGIIPVISGGTGLGDIPTNGQLLIGNGTGYTLNTLSTGDGISVTDGSGTVTLTNTGVLSWSGGTTGLTPSTATTGAVVLSGTLNIAHGGTNTTATPTLGSVVYGTGAAQAYSSVGSSGQVLISSGAGAPIWGPNAGAVGPAGPMGPAIFLEAPEAEESTAIPGQRGDVGVTGAQGATGPAVYLAAPEADEPMAIPGPQGNAGMTGAQGGTGPAVYLEAEQGEPGDIGPPGLRGATGAQGLPGVAVALDGQDGEDGLPIPGPRGATGATGATGSQGGTGPAVYLQAEQGDDGDIGPVGPRGATGATGSQGGTGPAVYLQAEQGDDGDIGPVGPRGATGATGSQGGTGPAVYLQAEQGDDGDIGPVGPRGATGETGATGSQGGTGPAVYLQAEQGDDGDIGPVGPRGATGATGATGSQGGTGPAVYLQAEQGDDGDIGPVGPRGAAGIQGLPGPAVYLEAPEADEPMMAISPAVPITAVGILKGTGATVVAAVANTDYVPLSTVLTKTANYTITGTDTWIINNKPTTALTLTFPAASSWTGRYITVKNMQAQEVNSATSNIVPIDSTTAGTAILLGVVGNWATLVSDGTNWIIMQAASNNNLLLE